MVKDFITNGLAAIGYQLKRLPDKYSFEDYKSYPSDSITEKKFYNIGAGAFYHPNWTNIDFVSDWYGKVQKNVRHYDLMSLNSLPIASNDAEIIYTSHTIEHVSDKAVDNLFKETYRVLKPGGVLRVTTGPDADLDWRAMKNGDASWFYWDEWYSKPGSYENTYHKPANLMSVYERWLHHVASQLVENDVSPSKIKFSSKQIQEIVERKTMEESLNYFTAFCEFNPARPGNHISWWNYEKIADFLKRAGFEFIYRSGYGQSAYPVLRNTALFDNTHPQMSVYVEAIKR